MKSERVILSFVAVLVGLMAAGATYFIYLHYFKNQPEAKMQTVTLKSSTPTPTPHNTSDFLTITAPSDETVTDNRTIQITGKASKNATVVVSTASTDQVAIASADGSFSLSTTLDDDTNLLEFTAFFPDGSAQTVQRTVTYSTETF